ncbi:MAG: rhodanese-like domain-containing protein [Bacteroidota bacterium]|nr:rhodanese-like domain-containing protein [Bacteroidota bacterium]
MKKLSFIFFCSLSLLFISCDNSSAQNPENWTKDQLIEPAALAKSIYTKQNDATIFSVGPGAVIPNSVDIGMVKEEANMNKFKEAVDKLPKDAHIVIYCGCCPFEKCPNVRPAIAYLKDQLYTNYYLLDLATNIKMDWIDKGYPVVKE